MERYIKNPHHYTLENLKNTDWDMIELNVSYDLNGLLDWYRIINTDLASCKFSMSPDFYEKYLEPSYLRRWSISDNVLSNNQGEYPSNWTLQWNRERYDPLPFPHLANRRLFPEVDDPSFSEKDNPFLSKYMFGAFESLHNNIGKYFQKGRVLTIPAGSKVSLHHDIKPGKFLFKLHFQLDMNDQCSWFFDYDASREYVMENGKLYLVNTSIIHGAINSGNTDWTMIHFSPKLEYIDEILSLSGAV